MAQLIEGFCGHGQQKQWLFDQIVQDKLPNSIIMQGSAGVGKKLLAQAALQLMNCSKPQAPCGECSLCLRASDDKNEFVYLLKPEGKKVISVDQVREVHQFLSLKSIHKARFVIIDPADKLTPQAANSLLKVLEESPQGSYFFLITEQVRGLLPTIRSRSHILRFSRLSPQELAAVDQFDPVVLSWSHGRVGMATQLQEPDNIQLLNDSLQFLYGLVCEPPQDWKKKAPWFFGKQDESRSFAFEIWEQALSKRLNGVSESLEWLPQDSARLSFIFEKVADLKTDLDANVDKLLAIENFYYQLRSRGGLH